MIVVSDTSPITSLAAIGRLDLLHDLYGEILIPPAVARELKVGEDHGDHAPFLAKTKWITVCPVTLTSMVGQLLLEEINLGEAEAIALAIERKADFLLIDEAAGRSVAEDRGLEIIGLLGALLLAKKQGLIPSVRELIGDLVREGGFWVSHSLVEEILAEAGE